MKSLFKYLNEVYTRDVLSGETYVDSANLQDEEYLGSLFVEIIDDATYNLDREFGIRLNPMKVAEIITKAMENYKNYK